MFIQDESEYGSSKILVFCGGGIFKVRRQIILLFRIYVYMKCRNILNVLVFFKRFILPKGDSSYNHFRLCGNVDID